MKIAVLISTLGFDSQKQLIRGVSEVVKKRGDQCYIFCCYGGINGLDRYNEGEFSIMNLPDFREFDGVIFVKNTIYDQKLGKKICASIKKTGVPCVIVNSYEEDFVSIGIDNKRVITKIVDHMVEEHDCRKIFYVSGPKGNSDAELRMAGFKETIKKHGIEYNPKYVYFGDYKLESGKAAVKYFLDELKEMPDVFVCANDTMAIGVNFELAQRNIKVPEETKVTGVDNIYEAKVHSPQITTVARPQFELGKKACEILGDYDSYKKGEFIELEAPLINTESCGCYTFIRINDREVRRRLVKGKYEWGDLSGTEKSVSCELSLVNSIAELRESIMRFVRLINPEIFCLLRCEDDYDEIATEGYVELIKRYSSTEYRTDFTDTIIPEIVYINGQLIKTQKSDGFPKKALIPDYIEADKPGQIYFFIPLHHMDKCYGYCMLGNSELPLENSLLFTWVNAIASAFEMVYKQTSMKQLIATLDRMWVYDTMTGLYNRAGFLKLAENIIAENKLKKQKLTILFFDMDGLKTVNDMYGHEEGDIYIKAVGKVLMENRDGNELIMRYGGDEFVILMQNADEKRIRDYIKGVKESAVRWKEENKKPYDMSSSVGSYTMLINSIEELSKAVEHADIEMYKEKKAKKEKKLKKELDFS